MVCRASGKTFFMREESVRAGGTILLAGARTFRAGEIAVAASGPGCAATWRP
jgi:hypothetical protein